ncbi:hypothetical protein ACFVH7_17880 [Kitasatospora indigofera]|uniref:hypothetical protein n=1 Tax=Kitasatospora indigofera TaxID=67307 RepID=UPI003640745B
MTWSISRDAQIAELRQQLHSRSATLAGSRSHTRLQAECDAISDEIERLKASRSMSPKALLGVLVSITVLALMILR